MKWDIELSLNTANNIIWWEKLNLTIHKNYKDCKLKWFQFRIIHRILGTNSFLNKIGYSDTNLCTFCNNSVETISHVLYYCEYSSQLWQRFENWIKDFYEFDINLDNASILLGFTEKKYYSLNIIICNFKYYIYKEKLNNKIPRFENAKKYFLNYLKLQRYIFKKNFNIAEYDKIWGKFNSILNV